MEQSFKQLAQQIESLHFPPMTALEQQLKRHYLSRADLHNRVLSSTEMSEYIAWMMNRQQGNLLFSYEKVSALVTSKPIAATAQNLLQNQRDSKSLQALSQIFDHPVEEHYFSEQQSITAGHALRYMPAYWNSSDFFEIYYSFSGKTSMWIHDEQLILTPGQIILFPPGTTKAHTCIDDDCSLMYFMLRASTFTQTFAQQLSNQSVMSMFFQQALFGTGRTDYLIFDTDIDPDLEFLLYAIYCEQVSESSYSGQLVNSFMQSFFLLLLQRYEKNILLPPVNPLHWKPEFSNIFNYIQTNFSSVTMETLSREFGYSRKQLSRIVFHCTGMTFADLTLRLRMEHAAILLHRRNLPMQEIAAAVGYSTLSSFYRAFQNYFKCTPRKYADTEISDME